MGLLANAEAGENSAQQIFIAKLAGDLVERLLAATQVLGHQFSRSAIPVNVLGMQ